MSKINKNTTEHIDIIIIGAGLSGIGAAYYLQKNCANKSLAILEGRKSIGGTWDLFRYPGIRSDSDMFTYGYKFNPWTDKDSLASGDKILNYLKQTIQQNKLAGKIRLSHRVKGLSWSSEQALWTIELDVDGDALVLTSNFVLCCNGYYDYQQGYQPEFKNRELFNVDFVHPQHWPKDLEWGNKNIVVIGSGATAVTLVPNLAKTAAHVTMLQRSPTYIVSMPMQDPVLRLLEKLFPKKWVSKFARKRNIFISKLYYSYMKKFPDKARKLITRKRNKDLNSNIDAKHFEPRYDPWDQRLCLIPDGDLFHALNEKTISIKTDTIEEFTDRGIKLSSGEELVADIIISATGLQIKIMNGIDFKVDGESVPFGDKMFYRGVLLEDVPNLGFVFGYTNASWTLKAELVSEYFSRVINYMDENKKQICIPKDIDKVERELFLNLSSGYIKRAQQQIPKQGSKLPWRLDQNYNKDKKQLRAVAIDDGVLKFTKSY
ncbi:MAG: NAD(P)/FAD-dependent oxidoreductase [Kangiellaceae bacterium]|nr:NAD(P)/FAD-dependent oxidoreductase [Kangiellaceae bacterium]